MIGEYELKRIPGGCDDDPHAFSVQAVLPADISALFPYVNACLPGCAYNHAGRVLSWDEGAHRVVLRAQELAISNFPTWAEASAAMERLVRFLNRTWAGRDAIQPREQPHPQPTPLAVYRLLPNTNCRECGQPTCYTFALKLVARAAAPADCSPLAEPGREEQRNALQGMLLPPPAVLSAGK